MSDSECDHDHTISDFQEGYIVCMSCGRVVDSCKMDHPWQWRDGCSAVPKSVYKRKHHFAERIAQWMCDDRIVPNEVIDTIRRDMTPPLNKSKIRAILRKNQWQKYIENWIQLYCRTLSEPFPMVDKDILEEMKTQFMFIEVAFIKTRPTERKSMLNYNYLFLRLLQYHGLKEHYKWFPALKSRVKVKFLDGVWKDICNFNNFPYQPLPTSRLLR
jgi:hypothetical protein